MGFVSTTSLHTVTILEPNKQLGSSAGVKYNWKPANPPVQHKCRVVPVLGQDRTMLLQRGYDSPHRIHFSFRPRGIDLSKFLRWEPPLGDGTIFRVKSIPLDASGLGRHYICLADAKTEDNENLPEIQ